jgi:uncharacterized sporulation protein YeaH/YhbH (DUF444 family)
LARIQFTAIKNAPDPVTRDDIVNLKREKQNLIREGVLLRAKLGRYAASNRHVKPPGRNQQIANSLEREVGKLTELAASKRAQIAKLVYSDRAATITELQEESKMLYLELLRLRRVAQEAKAGLRQISAQRQHAAEKCSPAAVARQEAQIRSLERDLAVQRSTNDAIREKIAAQELDESEQESATTRQTIKRLREQVRKEQHEISALDREMARMRADHAAEMQQIRAQIWEM